MIRTMINNGELETFIIIGLTGYTSKEDVDKFRRAGLDDNSKLFLFNFSPETCDC